MNDEPIDMEKLDKEAFELLGKILTIREREVVALSYGLNGYDVYTLAEVGRIFKITKERARQIRDKALSKLKKVKEEPENYLWIKLGI